MSTELPRISSGLTGVQIGPLAGFRGQEDWGRWTLGKVSEVSFRTERSLWVEGHIKFGLPFPQQNATITLNGERIAEIRGLRQPATCELRLALQLKAGNNIFRIETNKSNRSPENLPFAPKDVSDIALSISEFELIAVQPFTAKSSGQIYNTLILNTSAAYKGVAGTKAQFFVQAAGQQMLNYRLLGARDGQIFQIQLDGRTLLNTTALQRGTLAVGQIPLELSDQLHTVSVVTRNQQAAQAIVPDSVGNLEYYNGSFPFYIQELSLTPSQPWQSWQQPAAGLGACLCVAVLTWWLLRPRQARSSSKRL